MTWKESDQSQLQARL